MSDKVRIGIIGTSWWADWVYFPSFKSHPMADVVALCGGSNRARAEEMAAKYDIPHVYMDYHQLIKHDGLDAVAIITPDDLHYPMTMEALDANLHIICEKPLALNAQQARKMYEKAEVRGVKHMVFFTYRWNPYFRYIKDLVDEGYIGRCFFTDFGMFSGSALGQKYYWKYDAQRANGILGDLGSHLFDLARWYVGNIAKVNAQLGMLSTRPGYDDAPITPANDLVGVNLLFTGGTQGLIRTTGLSTEAEYNIRLCGDAGQLCLHWLPFNPIGMQIRGVKRGEGHLVDMDIPHRYIEGLDMDNLMDPFIKQKIGPRLFVDAIVEDKPVTPSFKDGLEAQKVIDAALESDRNGCWVEIKRDE
jgi:predicted dehydrogenase